MRTERKTKIIPLRLSKSEWELLTQVAAATDRPVSNMIRHFALEAARKTATQGGAHA